MMNKNARQLLGWEKKRDSGRRVYGYAPTVYAP